MKNYKLYNIGDKVEIVRTHGDDLGMVGAIIEVRHSFCKIQLPKNNPQNGKPIIVNHTYGQFKKL